MIQFPETARVEWEAVADAAQAKEELRKRIERGTKVESETERLRVRHEASLIFQQELDADDTPALEMMTLTNYKSTPAAAPADMIDGVVKANGLTIVIGPAGSGKSTAALQMLHSMMTGDDWLGQPSKTIMGSVGVMSYDMDAAMLMDWMSNFPNIDPSKVSMVNAHKRGNPLGVPAMREQIAAAWRSMNVEVVMIDSFSASFFGQDQNDTAHTMAHYRDMLRFALTEVGAKALIVIAHSTESSPRKIRGSTAHHDVADSIVAVVADQTGARHVNMVKYRAALGQKQMSPVVVTEPDSVTHLVDLDLPAMQLAGYDMPTSAVASVFPDLPETHDAPDTDSATDDEEDDL